MKITIISVGKIKEKYLKDGINEYLKRLSRFCILNIIEVSDESISDNPSNKDIEIVKQKESQSILKSIDSTSFIITLELEGQMLTSELLANKLDSIFTYSNSHITFVIGGSLGLHSSVTSLSNYKLSLSKLTYTHQHVRLIILEQIYRSFKILKNETYHK
ncbi:MAG: 23S rRNA (pseudouridine(1915)-N(3))-methyltransferase RlmH [Anaeroplasmataceae bacterium]